MASLKVAYASSAAATITLASLATSATLVTGRQSTVVSNTTNLYLDYLIGGKITTGTTPTVGVIEVWAFGSVEDTPTYTDGFGASDAAHTATTRDILLSSAAKLCTLINTTSSNVTYWFGPVSLAAAFGRLYGGGLFVPKNWGLFVTHSTVAALNSTAGNHALWHTGVYMTSA